MLSNVFNWGETHYSQIIKNAVYCTVQLYTVCSIQLAHCNMVYGTLEIRTRAVLKIYTEFYKYKKTK
jgi:hypothetical protein